jgi:predicted transcriptional regulator
MTRVILDPVKTAISLPDDLFRRAEDLAQRLGIPRSQLYARALSRYVADHAPSHITAALDEVYQGLDSSLDRDLAAAQRHAVAEEDW